MTENKYYSVEIKSPLAMVYLDRPDKKNAMNAPAWWDAPGIFEELDKNNDVKVIIISGKGKSFCAGIDLMAMIPELGELMEPEQKGGVKWKLIPKIKKMQEAMNCIEKCRKPVIAAIHGHCIGAGLDMAAACDIRLCSEDAVFSLREAAVGIVADMGVLQRLPHITGQGIARELAFTAKFIDSKRAKEIHLVNQVFETKEELMAEAEKMAMEIAQDCSSLAVQASKNVLNFGIGKTINEGLDYVASISANIIPSDDLFEAFKAFGEKRKPDFLKK